jgi:ribulose 1,5-bisphosphate synthetase/thiazole synthase
MALDSEGVINHITPILVVGAGPIGMFTAYQLARLDVPCILADQYEIIVYLL